MKEPGLTREGLADRVVNRIKRGYLAFIFKAWYGRRHARLSLEHVNGLALLVPPEVFNPTLFGSSIFLANYLRRNLPPPKATVLDIGCGSGLLGLELARQGRRVLATDLNPQAVWASQVNAHLNGCEDFFEARQGPLYEPVGPPGRKFDLIVMNPPYYPGVPRSALETAFKAGPGLETLTAMLVGTADFLSSKGYTLAVLSSTIPLKDTLKQVEQAGLDWEIAARRRYWAEWHLIYRFQLRKECLPPDDN